MGNDIMPKAKIMIIDEDIGMMDIISAILGKYGHQVFPYTEPVSAIEALKSQDFDILLINYLMSPVNGDRIIELVRQFNKDIYIILMSTHKDLVPSIDTMINLDIQGYFEKSARFDQLIMLIQSGIKYTEQLKNIKKMSTQLESYLIDFAKVLLNAIGAKDHFTADHSLRVSKYCDLFANYLNLNEQDHKSFVLAGMFHDIGKIGIADSILSKDGKLTKIEYDAIKLHPIIGANILSVSDMFKTSAPAIRCHHEWYNGKGYPFELKGEEIPYLGRALSLCDSFDAITSIRPYKECKSIDFAIEQIKEGMSTQFDPKLAKLFLKMLDEKSDEIAKIHAIKQVVE